jgi:hypothetical protein
MLQMAVHPIQELCQVKSTAMLLKVHTNKDLDYEQYSALSLSTATHYDSKLVGTKGKRQVYAHDTMNYDDDDYYEAAYDDDPFDLDTPVDTIQAFASKFTPKKVPGNFNDRERMPKDKWLALIRRLKNYGIG